MNIFELMGSISIEGLDRVGSQLQGLGFSLQNVGSAITGFGNSVYDSVTKPLIGLVENGIKYNMTMEDLTTSFDVMLGSAEKAGKMVQNLKEMGAATPFDTIQLAEYTKTMLAFGYTEANVIPIMSKLGDISLGNNEKMLSLTRTMGQINSLGRLQGGDLNQLIGQGWNPLNEITKKTGETMEQVRDRMSKGKVTYKEVEDALVSATSKGGTFYEGMAKGSQTLSGRISTLRDNFESFIGSAVEPLSEFLGNTLIPILTKLAEKLNNLSPHVKVMILVFAGIIGAIGPLLIVFGTLISVIAVVITSVGVISSFLAALSPVVLVVAGAIGIMVAVFTAIGAAIGYVLVKTGSMTQIFNLMKDAFNQAKPIVVSLAQEGFVKLQQAFSLVKGILDQVVAVAKPFLLSTIKQAKPIILDLIVAIGKFGSTILSNIGNSLKVIKQVWTTVWPALKPVVETVFGGIKIIILTVLSVIKGIINTATAVMKGDWSAAWNGIKSIFSSIWNGIKSLAVNMVSGLVNVIATIGPKIRSGLSQIPGIVKSIASSALSAAISVGKAIVDGMVKGIKNGIKWVANAAADLAKSAVNAANSILDIGSPSKVFQEIGDYVNQGFIIGLDTNKIKDTMANITDLATSPFNNTSNLKLNGNNNQDKNNKLNGYSNSINTQTNLILNMYNNIDKNVDSDKLFNDFAKKLKQSGLVITHA